MTVTASQDAGKLSANQLNDIVADRPLAATQVTDVDWKAAALSLNHRARLRATEGCSDRRGLQGGTRDHNPQVGPEFAAKAAEHAEDQVHLDGSLMELIEHHAADAFKRHVVKQTTEHDPGGFDRQPRLTRGHHVEANAVANLTTQPTATATGDLCRDRTGRQPSWLD